ncbi:hypothetical protein [Bradyrhizobium sp. 23AC]
MKEAGPKPCLFFVFAMLSPTRHCERCEATQNLSTAATWIASSQERSDNKEPHAHPVLIRASKSSFTIRVDRLFTASRDDAFTTVRDQPVKTPAIA